MGNSVSSMLGVSEEAKQENKNILFKRQLDYLVTGKPYRDGSISAILHSIEHHDNVKDYRDWANDFVSKNSDDPEKINQYMKKQNVDSVSAIVTEDYEQAYYAMLISNQVQEAAIKKNINVDHVGALPIDESLEMMKEKLSDEDRMLVNTVLPLGLAGRVRSVAYQDENVISKDSLEANIMQGYAMAFKQMYKGDYFQAIDGFNITKGLKDVMQKEYPNAQEQSEVRGVLPQFQSFAQRGRSGLAR